MWIKVKNKSRDTIIGGFYGPQEKIDRYTVKKIYTDLTNHIKSMQHEGNIVLLGDFNAKLEIHEGQIQQNKSPNGVYLKDLIEETGMRTPTTDPGTIEWTRENRTNTQEKSVIDYILCDQGTYNNIIRTNINTDNSLTLRGKKLTDHNTITIEIKNLTERKTQEEVKPSWVLDNKEGWSNLNRELASTLDQDTNPNNYENLAKTLTKLMKKHIKKSKPPNKQKPTTDKNTKDIKNRKKLRKREFKEACKTKNNTNIKQALDRLTKAQKEMKEAIELQEKSLTRIKLDRLIQAGGTKSNMFWKTRKQILKSKQLEADTKNEQGKTIHDPQEAKEHVAKYFEELYQAREGNRKYDTQMNKIMSETEEIKERLKHQREKPFTMKELNDVVKTLKRKKAPGPDDFPNEILIEATPRTKKAILDAFNKINQNMNIPRAWTEGNIKTIYKGKGHKGMCSNQRGITLSSNMGKIYERLINNRVKQVLEITEAQAGGKRGASTADHLMVLKETIKQNQNRKKPTYLTFLDVTKAYDKAWIQGIMHV